MAVVSVDLPEDVLRDLRQLADSKDIPMTEALIEAVTTAKVIAEKAPNGARIVPVSARAARKSTV